jgi:hypothetical protein
MGSSLYSHNQQPVIQPLGCGGAVPFYKEGEACSIKSVFKCALFNWREEPYMIKTLGKNGPKVIQVDMTAPQPVHEPTEGELQILELHNDLERLQQIIARGEMDGKFDQAKEMIKKAQKFMVKKVQNFKQAMQPKVTVDLPDKLYDELEAILDILIHLVQAITSAGGQAGPDDTNGPQQSSSAADVQEAPGPLVYVIRGSWA